MIIYSATMNFGRLGRLPMKKPILNIRLLIANGSIWNKRQLRNKIYV